MMSVELHADGAWFWSDWHRLQSKSLQ